MLLGRYIILCIYTGVADLPQKLGVKFWDGSFRLKYMYFRWRYSVGPLPYRGITVPVFYFLPMGRITYPVSVDAAGGYREVLAICLVS